MNWIKQNWPHVVTGLAVLFILAVVLARPLGFSGPGVKPKPYDLDKLIAEATAEQSRAASLVTNPRVWQDPDAPVRCYTWRGSFSCVVVKP